jgi:hypothetical protein
MQRPRISSGAESSRFPLRSLTHYCALISLPVWHASAPFGSSRGSDRPTFALQQGHSPFPARTRLGVAQSQKQTQTNRNRIKERRRGRGGHCSPQRLSHAAPAPLRARGFRQCTSIPEDGRVGFPADSRLLANRFHGTRSWEVAPPRTHVYVAVGFAAPNGSNTADSPELDCKRQKFFLKTRNLYYCTCLNGLD